MALIYYTNDILLIWQDEKVYGDLNEAFLLPRVCFCEAYRDLVVWGISEHRFQSKGQMIASCPPHHRKGSTIPEPTL